MPKTLNGPCAAISRRRFTSSSLAAVALVALFVWAAIDWYQAGESITRFYNPLPLEDYWRVAGNLNQYKNLDLRFLWHPHNEHRILFPELVFACDMLFARGRQLLPLILSCLAYFSILVFLARAVLRDNNVSLPVRWAAALLMAVVVGWKGNAFVLAEPFLLQWTLTQLAIVIALVLICHSDRTLVSPIAAAVVATYSSGNGMLVWPVLIAAALLLKRPKRQMAVLAAAGSLAVGLYFVGYESPSRLQLGNFFLHPIYSLEFIGAYIGMPFGGMKAPRFGAYVGVVSLALMILLFIRFIRKNLAQSPVLIVLYGCYAFGVLTAILTAAGRMDPTDVHYSGAEAVRYITLPLVTWAVFIAATIWGSARLRWRFLGPWLITGLISLLLLIGFPKLRWWFRDNQGPFVDAQLATLSIENGLIDSNLMAMLFPDPGFVRNFLPELRSNHLSIYSKPTRDIFEKPLGSFGPVINRPVLGRISYSFPVEHGLEVAGFRDLPDGGKILLANEQQKIVGFGESLPAGFPAWIPIPQAHNASKWVGFANLAHPSKALSAYAVTPSGLVALGTPVIVPDIRPVSERETGAPIPSVTFQTKPPGMHATIPMSFIVNPPGPVYSTWQHVDDKPASIESSGFAVPPGRCLVLPVLTGPLTQGLSAAALNESTGEVVASIPMQDRSRWWQLWRLPIPAGVDRVRILAEDRETGWGRWIALATPYQCR